MQLAGALPGGTQTWGLGVGAAAQAIEGSVNCGLKMCSCVLRWCPESSEDELRFCSVG